MVSVATRAAVTALSIADWYESRARRFGMKPADVAQNTSPETRSRWRRHSNSAMGPPIE